MTTIILQGEVPVDLTSFDTYQVYNCLDSAVTAQLAPVIESKFANTHRTVYEREMRLQSLCLEMSTKGFPIDQWSLAELLWQLEKDAKRAQHVLDRFCEAVAWIGPFNPASPKQVAELFYDHLNLPTQYEFDHKKGVRKVSTDRKAMEKLRDNYPIAAPFVNAIDACKVALKLASVFKRGLEPDTGNLRCNFSPSGTETGRLSSQQNPYGRGTNAQNLTDRVRQVVAAPPGYAIVNLDLKTAESIAVGYISRCQAYIDACLSGDVHTAGCRLVWTDMPWTGDIKQDKALAEQPAYRIFSWRDLMKKGGHATNYYGKPRTLQKVAFLGQATIAFVEEFQAKYFGAFPEIEEWHLRTIAELQTSGAITTPLGRERRFWGRSDDPATHREAIAYAPQSLVADAWNEGLMALQRWIVANAKTDVIDLRAQVHDSGVFLVALDGLHELVAEMTKRVIYPVDFGDLGTMRIPVDATIGRRWNKMPKKGGSKYMLSGQRDYTPGMDLDWLRQAA